MFQDISMKHCTPEERIEALFLIIIFWFSKNVMSTIAEPLTCFCILNQNIIKCHHAGRLSQKRSVFYKY